MSYAAALEFYGTIFGWRTEVVSDTPEFRYTTFADGDLRIGGVIDGSGFMPDGVPSHWEVYLGCTDTDASTARAVELGGAIVEPPQDSPYGRVATLADPTGARFKLITT